MIQNFTNDLSSVKKVLPPKDQKELDIIFGGPNPQYSVFSCISYLDHHNNRKIIVSAAYNIVHETLPTSLPTLLPPLQSPPAYAIRAIPGKGKGLVATRDIAFGEIVIIERPVLLFPRLMFDMDSFTRFPIYARLTMDPKDWIKYNDLVNVKGDVLPEFDGIKATNAFEIDLQKGKESYSGVFLEISRLNHSCGPNLRSAWDSHLFTFSVQAVRPIRAGQELTVSYVDTFLPRDERQSTLETHYKFKCKCIYCVKPSPTSDYHRETSPPDATARYFEDYYNNILLRLPRHIGRAETQLFLTSLIGGLVTITKEGIESVSALIYYVCLMKLHGLLGDTKKFKEWGFKAILTSVKYVEADGEKARREIEQWIDWLRDPEKMFPQWGRCQ